MLKSVKIDLKSVILSLNFYLIYSQAFAGPPPPECKFFPFYYCILFPSIKIWYNSFLGMKRTVKGFAECCKIPDLIPQASLNNFIRQNIQKKCIS